MGLGAHQIPLKSLAGRHPFFRPPRVGLGFRRAANGGYGATFPFTMASVKVGFLSQMRRYVWPQGHHLVSWSTAALVGGIEIIKLRKASPHSALTESIGKLKMPGLRYRQQTACAPHETAPGSDSGREQRPNLVVAHRFDRRLARLLFSRNQPQCNRRCFMQRARGFRAPASGRRSGADCAAPTASPLRPQRYDRSFQARSQRLPSCAACRGW
jgi:hypothetical protein